MTEKDYIELFDLFCYHVNNIAKIKNSIVNIELTYEYTNIYYVEYEITDNIFVDENIKKLAIQFMQQFDKFYNYNNMILCIDIKTYNIKKIDFDYYNFSIEFYYTMVNSEFDYKISKIKQRIGYKL